jgi:flagellar motor switch protein FliG
MGSLIPMSNFNELGPGLALGEALTPLAKAAIVVRVMIEDGIDVPLSELPDELQDALIWQMSRMRSIDRDVVEQVVDEFVNTTERIGLAFSGGLQGAYSKLEGKMSVNSESRVRQQLGLVSAGDPWDLIAEIENDQIVKVLMTESIEVGSILLSKLKVIKAAELLGMIPGPRARRVAYAMSQTAGVTPSLVLAIGRTLLEQLSKRQVFAFERSPVDRVGAILNSTQATTRDDILAGLDETDIGFAKEVRKAIFTFANIPTRIDPRDIQKITRKVDAKLLLTALAYSTAANADDPTCAFIYANLSQRMAQQLKEEAEGLGSIKEKDAEIAVSAIVQAIRDLEAAGEISLVAEAEEVSD